MTRRSATTGASALRESLRFVVWRLNHRGRVERRPRDVGRTGCCLVLYRAEQDHAEGQTNVYRSVRSANDSLQSHFIVESAYRPRAPPPPASGALLRCRRRERSQLVPDLLQRTEDVKRSPR